MYMLNNEKCGYDYKICKITSCIAICISICSSSSKPHLSLRSIIAAGAMVVPGIRTFVCRRDTELHYYYFLLREILILTDQDSNP